MSRIILQADDDPGLRVDLVEVDPVEGDWDGVCSRCSWTIHKACGLFPGQAVALMEAAVHVDHQH